MIFACQCKKTTFKFFTVKEEEAKAVIPGFQAASEFPSVEGISNQNDSVDREGRTGPLTLLPESEYKSKCRVGSKGRRKVDLSSFAR